MGRSSRMRSIPYLLFVSAAVAAAAPIVWGVSPELTVETVILVALFGGAHAVPWLLVARYVRRRSLDGTGPTIVAVVSFALTAALMWSVVSTSSTDAQGALVFVLTPFVIAFWATFAWFVLLLVHRRRRKRAQESSTMVPAPVG